MNLKKINISLVTASLLYGVSLLGSATTSYVPITTTSNDYTWKLFGVNGFSREIIIPANPDTVNTSYTSLSDNKTIAGTAGWNLNGKDLGKLKLLNKAAQTTINLYTDLTNINSIITQFQRVMYISAPNSNTPIAELQYNSALEGKDVDYEEIGTQNASIYTFRIDANNTYSNPVEPKLKVATEAIYSTPDTKITSIIDFNLSNNPTNPTDFNFNDHFDNGNNANGTTARIYRYDSINGVWELWDKDNDANINDFDTLEKGRGYWIKIDDGDKANSNSNSNAGLILGNEGVETGDYNNTIKLAEGWNLISFDNKNNNIREAVTGLIVETMADTVSISDISGVYQVTMSLSNDNIQNAKLINTNINKARDLNQIPENFKLTALTNEDGKLILLSNIKFIIKGKGFGAVTTLAGQDVWSEDDQTRINVNDVSILTNGVSSVYGEYGMVIEPLVGPNTASNLDSLIDGPDKYSAAIMINNDENQIIPFSENHMPTTLTTANNTINSHISNKSTNLKNSIEIDMNNDGINDHILISSTSNFYIKDYTFTKVFDFNSTNANSKNSYYIQSYTTVPQTEIPDINYTINDIRDDINMKLNDTKVYSTLNNTSDKLIMVSASQVDFRLLDLEPKFFIESTSDDDIAKGAVKAVYNIKDLIDASKTTGTISLPNPITEDLNYKSINVQDMPDDGPLYVFRELGYDIKSLVSGITDMTNNNIYWSNIDLTASKDIWYSSNNYNLFNVNSKTGYWAYLEDKQARFIERESEDNVTIDNKLYFYDFGYESNNQNIIEIKNIDLKFKTDTNIKDISDLNVYLIISGNKYKLIPDSKEEGKYSSYIGKFNSIKSNQGDNKEIILSANDGLGTVLESKTIGMIDVIQPDAPTLPSDMGDGSNIELNSSSVDVKGIYLYNTYIPEYNTEDSELKLDYNNSNTISFNICKYSTINPTFGEPVNELKIFAVDGKGTLNNGLISDSLSISPHPILKGSNVLESIWTDGIANKENNSTGYNNYCERNIYKDGDYGVTIQSKEENRTVKLAFVSKKQAASSSNAIGGLQESMYIKDTSSNTGAVAQILFDNVYIGEKFYIQIDNKTYMTTFQDKYSVSTSALIIDDATNINKNISTEIPNQSF